MRKLHNRRVATLSLHSCTKANHDTVSRARPATPTPVWVRPATAVTDLAAARRQGKQSYCFSVVDDM